MNHVRYRLEALPAALNTRKMHGYGIDDIKPQGLRIILVAAMFAVALIHVSRPPARIQVVAPAPIPDAGLAPLLAASRMEAARANSELGQPGEALALAVSALIADPENTAARALAREILTRTTWSAPETTLAHHRPIDHLAFSAPSSLWVSVSGEANTTVKWNLASMKIESALFPLKVPETRSLVFDPNHRSVVIERGGVALLCDAMTLRPIREIGTPPPFATPSSVIVFSPDGLLVAHPILSAGEEPTITWHLRDAATGQIIRSSDPSVPDAPRPLAAFLDRSALRVLREDGSLWILPVSMIEATEEIGPPGKLVLHHAAFSAAGDSALVLKDSGPHASPTLEGFIPGGGGEATPTAADFLEREPWTRQPSLWTGLLRDTSPPLSVHENTALISGHRAPLRATAAITAAAFSGDRSFIASADGMVTIHRHIPPPAANLIQGPPVIPDPGAIRTLAGLTEALTGFAMDETGGLLPQSPLDRRLKALENCDFGALSRVFPGLDFAPVIDSLRALKPHSPPPDAAKLLDDRIARASLIPADRSSQARLEKIFKDGDPDAVAAAIHSAGTQGPDAAKALELALASTQPEWIEASVSRATNLPPLLRKLAASRIAWLQDSKAEALTAWPDGFPDLNYVRQREDWDGWEQADFSKALEQLDTGMERELAAIDVPANPSPEERQALFERLSDPTAIRTVGRERFARACLNAALAFADFEEETEATFKLANIARNLGEDPVPCLRAEALALTTLGDYAKARERWVTLITEHPVESHQPSDYAEAAYTSFENLDSRQAMEILNTGLQRYPNDPDFSLRAGWIALLTGNGEQAYRYLLAGRKTGFPHAKLEDATALLAIAAVQAGAAGEAATFYQELIGLNPDWEKPETIEALDWPAEMKASLRQLVW